MATGEYVAPSGPEGEVPQGAGNLAEGQEQQAQPFTEAQLQGLDERYRALIEQARDQGRREMQSTKDQEIRRREAAEQQRLAALDNVYASKFTEMGASPEQLQGLRQLAQSQTEEIDKDARLAYLEDIIQKQGADYQRNQTIDRVLELAGIPRSTPGLVLTGTQEDFYASVEKAKAELPRPQGAVETREPGEAVDDTERHPSRPDRVASGAADVVSGPVARARTTGVENDFKDAPDLLAQGIGGKPRNRR